MTQDPGLKHGTVGLRSDAWYTNASFTGFMTSNSPEQSSRHRVDLILAAVDGSPGSYLAAARELAKLAPGELELVRVGVLSTFTVDLVKPYMAVEGARRGFAIDVHFAPFGQLEQQVLEPTGSLYAWQPHVIVVAARVDDLSPALVDRYVSLSSDEVANLVQAYVQRVGRIAEAIRANSSADILVWNQPAPAMLAAGLADVSLVSSQADLISALNSRLAAGCRSIPGVTIFDAARLATEVGLRQWYDAKLYHLGRIPFGSTAQAAIGKLFARYVHAMRVPPKKCIVLDLDNTLWGGVLGEEGVGGIAFGDDYPGNVFKAFQQHLRTYRDRGVLLAIASKNNEADVLEAFARHPDFVLGLEDFGARQVHWSDKASSLRAIAAELNIGTDALVFFDDNPVERDWIRAQMPEVAVIDVPSNPLRYCAALDEAGFFDQLMVTDEDRARAGQSLSAARRSALQVSSSSVQEFLTGLEMRATIGVIDSTTLPRVVQLLGKTNQFNVTTRRHSQADLERMLAAGAIGLWMRLEDRFGDNGIIGVAISVPTRPGEDQLDSFLMSCRVLGRKAELALLWSLARRVAGRGSLRLTGEFIPTKKNAPAAGFFAESGFAAVEGEPNHWRLDLTPPPQAPPFFEIIDRD